MLCLSYFAKETSEKITSAPKKPNIMNVTLYVICQLNFIHFTLKYVRQSVSQATVNLSTSSSRSRQKTEINARNFVAPTCSTEDSRLVARNLLTTLYLVSHSFPIKLLYVVLHNNAALISLDTQKQCTYIYTFERIKDQVLNARNQRQLYFLIIFCQFIFTILPSVPQFIF